MLVLQLAVPAALLLLLALASRHGEASRQSENASS